MSDPVQVPGLTDLVEIGRGGYGVVYRAWQEQLRRRVAIKVLAARLDGHAARRFAQECRALGTVSGHPNIVAVYDAGTTPDGQSYLVMPLYEDGSLLDRLNSRGPLPWQEALQTGIELAGALQTAHEAGILHRDIKPANVLVDGYGAARLADFGQARHTGDDMTQTAGIVATPGFSAPEILHGAPATARSDVFSLAATVMGLILGHGPFAGDTDENLAALLLRVVNEPAPDLRGRGVPGRLCLVLESAMEKRPSLRPESAEAFGADLQQAQRAIGLAATPMTIAGRAVRVLPSGPNPTSTTVPTGADPTVRSESSAQPPPPVAPPTAPIPSGTAAPGQAPDGGRRSTRRRALAAVLLLAVVGAGAVVAVAMTGGGKNAAAPSSTAASNTSGPGGTSATATAINVVDPRQLLLNEADEPGVWQKPAESNPSEPGEWSIFWDLMGTEPDSQKNVSPIPRCLGLPTLPAGSQQNVSDVSYSASPGYAQPGRYLVVQTMAFVMGSDALASRMVDPWRTRLQACAREVEAWSSYDDFSWINHDKSSQPAAGQSLAPTIVFSSPSLGVTLPDVVDQTFHRIQFQLVDKPQYTEISPRYFDLITMSAGTSVVYLAMQANGDPPAEAVRVAAVETLLAKLVS